MKSFKYSGVLFLLIGIASAVILIPSVKNNMSFMENSVVTEGMIVDIITERESGSSSRSDRLYPVVRFINERGSVVEFQSSSSLQSIVTGSIVEVRYLPGKENTAVISDSLLNIWGDSIVLSLFALIFGVLGGFWVAFGAKDGINEKRAMSYSKEINAKVNGVRKNHSFSYNGKHPFLVEAQWLNPDTNRVHLFKSKNLWYDPSQFLKSEVLIKADPNNLKKYWMDISFLPENA